MQYLQQLGWAIMKHLRTLQFIDTIARAGSIRRAAEELAIDSSALNRQVLAFEEEFGMPVFERLPRGVRLSTAGELLIQHIRTQLSDFSRLRSQIADLSGVRRGHVAIATTRAALPFFLPEQIALYRREHPAVTFDVQQHDRSSAEGALVDYRADIALAFEPVQHSEFQILARIRQQVVAIMNHDHPLADRESVRLRHCLEYPLALPSASAGVRQLLEIGTVALGEVLSPMIECESAQFLTRCACEDDFISFDIPLGISCAHLSEHGLVARSIVQGDMPDGSLYLGQLKGRALSVAASKFADQLVQALQK